MPYQLILLMLVIIGICVELRLPLKGIPDHEMEELGIDFTGYPPWHTLWPAFYVDMLCMPIGCRHTWRNYVPFGMAEKGQWFSREWEIVGVTRLLPDPLTFEEFREMQGFNVTPGSGLLAGVETADDIDEWRKSVYEYVFETPSTSLSNLTTPTALGVICILVLFIKAIKAIVMPQFEKIGRHMALKAHGEQWLMKNQERIIKFAEYVYRLCYHSFISLVGFYMFWNAPWWDEAQGGTRQVYTDWPDDPIKPSMTWYYLFQAAYNVDAMVSLLQISFQIKVFAKDSKLPISIGWATTCRGDFNEMLAHHVVTNTLVFLSSYLKQTRIGSMVFWMHDISDVPVDLAKLANFVKWKAGTIGFFFLLCATWFYTRLYVLPFTIWSSIFFHGQEVGRGLEEFWVYFYAYQPIFISLLAALILLHAVWFSMFIKMGILLVTKGETHDLTEHKKGEKQLNGTPKANGTAAVAATNGKAKAN